MGKKSFSKRAIITLVAVCFFALGASAQKKSPQYSGTLTSVVGERGEIAASASEAKIRFTLGYDTNHPQSTSIDYFKDSIVISNKYLADTVQKIVINRKQLVSNYQASKENGSTADGVYIKPPEVITSSVNMKRADTPGNKVYGINDLEIVFEYENERMPVKTVIAYSDGVKVTDDYGTHKTTYIVR